MHHNNELAKITSDREWQAYRQLCEAENKMLGIEAEPLPLERPKPSAEVQLSHTIDRAINLWQQHQPLKSIKARGSDIKAAFSLTDQQFKEDSYYHYQNAKTYLENTLSGAASILEDTLGISTSYGSTNYFIDSQDFLDNEAIAEPAVEEAEPQKPKNAFERVIDKGVEDIGIAEQAVFSFFNQFRGR